jgi:LL-diaminopimelate aminotransferase
MIRINNNYAKLASSYLFAEIARRVEAFGAANPDKAVIKLGIGDVTRALPPTVVAAFHRGVDEQAADSSFKGYGPERGYEFLRDAIAEVDFRSRGCAIDPDEIFVSDGAKCDTGNFQEIFAPDIAVAVPDPVYPVYVDTNVMAGRTGEWKDGRYEGLTYLDATVANGFVPGPPAGTAPDLIYLCYPNNPTGATASAAQLQEWVDYARTNHSIILFDAAYEQFIRDESIPHSIFEIPGARDVAVEFRSLSKTAGFTGTRCAYTVVPRTVLASGPDGTRVSIWDLWNRRQATKFNGVSFPVQRAAAAVYSETGQREIRALSDYYLENARIIRETMESLGYTCTGGTNSPYVWVETGADSWQFFDRLLQEAAVVITPGAGFGKNGEGFVRFSAFNQREQVEEAMRRVRNQIR